MKLGALLCAAGIHRWQWRTVSAGLDVRDEFRCRRRCRGYATWRAANVERRRPW